MVFPKFKNKQVAEALFSPEEFIQYKKWDKRKFPKKIIITYQKSVLNYFRKKFRGKYKRLKLYLNDEVLIYKKIGFLYVKGIGAPNIVTIVEELIALGAKEFINMGSAGGLIDRGVFLCNKAVRDEGTSHHYISDSIYSYPDKSLTNKLSKSLDKFGIQYTIGASWTIDAPYRETKKEIAHYRKKGIYTVEMEAASLFALGKFRRVKVASVFAVSDVLGDKKWDPQFHKFDFKRTLNKLLDVSLDCLSK
ncbi:hypothetical protein DRN73_02560 [Candidatus Pacearchaeota archaeon]|nr:MAG: hypothetical protein DRN73_02560 [Candidatus Pacearchaeota archaeon]